MIILYGIHNCDTVKKAQKWLSNASINYQFHDLRKDGLDSELLSKFVRLSDWSALINKRSTTFRNLSDEIKNNLTNDVAQQLVLEQPTLLKRPLLLVDNKLHLGFKINQYEELFPNA